jgi:hypothetical protein
MVVSALELEHWRNDKSQTVTVEYRCRIYDRFRSTRTQYDSVI